MQANEVIKYITGTGEILAGKILMFDAQNMQSRIVKIGSVSKTKVTAMAKTQTVPLVSVNEFKALMNDNIELVDVRMDEERLRFNIGGKHIPIALLEERFHEIDATKKCCSIVLQANEVLKP